MMRQNPPIQLPGTFNPTTHAFGFDKGKDADISAARPFDRRDPVQRLPYNTFTDRDGSPGGWSPWSAPFSFVDGQVDEFGQGGINWTFAKRG